MGERNDPLSKETTHDHYLYDPEVPLQRVSQPGVPLRE